MTLHWGSFRCRRGLRLVREVHYAMGTLLDVMLYHEEHAVGLNLLRQACRETRRLETLLSRHLPTSELSQLNAQAGQGPCLVSSTLFNILVAARQWAEATHGAFDPTVGVFLRLWCAAAVHGNTPAAAHLRAARGLVGWDKLRLIPSGRVELASKGMVLDCGGIGKGYAVDWMGAILRRRGVRHALINFGESSLLAIGPMPDGRPWPIRVRALDESVGQGTIAIQDQAVGTSASFGHILSPAGTPVSHIIDPRDGRPLAQKAALTVVASSATAAEALSTGLLVLSAGGETIPPLPPGSSAYHVRYNGELEAVRRVASDASVRHPRL